MSLVASPVDRHSRLRRDAKLLSQPPQRRAGTTAPTLTVASCETSSVEDFRYATAHHGATIQTLISGPATRHTATTRP